jgi:putative dimethyl sulfoxide reductase chaperone
MTEVEGQAAERSAIYWWLAAFYLAPLSAQALSQLGSDLKAWEREPHDALTARLAGVLATPAEGLAERLAVEHTRLFGGLQQGYGPPPPFESVWRTGQLMGEISLQVADSYLEAGYADIDPAAGPQDHLGVELKFMALLCFQEAQAWTGNRSGEAGDWLRRESAFLDQHLLAWVPGFCETIARESREPFYAVVAELTRQILTEDRTLLDATLEELQAA